MKTKLILLAALGLVTTVAVAQNSPKDLPIQDTAPGRSNSAAFGPKDLPVPETAPGFGPKDLPIQDTAPGAKPVRK